MLIPSIDLQNGRIVQLIQGEKLAVATDDVDVWIERFSRFPKIQLIDLDAAMSRGANDALVRRIAAALPCRVGGGVRTVTRAEQLIEAGAQAVIAGSGLFKGPGQWSEPEAAAEPVTAGGGTRSGIGASLRSAWRSLVGGGDRESKESGGHIINHDFAQALAETVGRERVIAAVDARAGRVVIHGWKTSLPISPVAAVRHLEQYCDEFLYTHVDKEGLMQGTDMLAIRAVREATTRRVTAAGGITTRDEIDALHAMGVDAVVGMAIYTGSLSLE